MSALQGFREESFEVLSADDDAMDLLQSKTYVLLLNHVPTLQDLRQWFFPLPPTSSTMNGTCQRLTLGLSAGKAFARPVNEKQLRLK